MVYSSYSSNLVLSVHILLTRWDMNRGASYMKNKLYGSSVYRTWNSLKQRCDNPKNKRYLSYGGRGITYDPRWKDFAPFYEDMGERPEGTSLDRIDNNKGYSKENCRWATAKEQQNNTRLTTFLTYEGRTMSLSDWADFFGISRGLIHSRLKRGKDLMDAFKPRVHEKNIKYLYRDEYRTIKEWSFILGISSKTLTTRMHRKWPLERVFSKKI